jgi:hypothetical protein
MTDESDSESGSSESSGRIAADHLAETAASQVAAYADYVSDFLQRHSTLVDEFQAMLLLRRPIEMVLLLCVVNGVFYLFSVMQPPIYSILVLATAAWYIRAKFGQAIWRLLAPHIYRPGLVRGKLEEPDRLRDIRDIAVLLAGPAVALGWAVQVWRALAAGRTTAVRLMRVWILLGLCLLFQAVDWFWIVAVAVNAILVLPAIWFNPDVVGWRKRIGRRWAATQTQQAAAK